MFKRKSIRVIVTQTALILITVIAILLVLLPLYVTINLSLKSSSEMLDFVLKPAENIMWSNYLYCLDSIWIHMLNSVIVCAISVFILLFISSLISYVITKHTFAGRHVIFLYFIALLAIPGVLSLTPQFILYKQFGLRDTWWALIIQYSIGGLSGAIFLFTAFFGQQPKDLFEAGKIDGANDFKLYTQLCLPLSVTIMIIQGLGSFSGIYNDYLWPLMMIDSAEKQLIIPTLTTLTQALEGSSKEPGIKYALYMLSGLPLIFITGSGLKFFINGDFASGMKL